MNLLPGGDSHPLIQVSRFNPNQCVDDFLSKNGDAGRRTQCRAYALDIRRLYSVLSSSTMGPDLRCGVHGDATVSHEPRWATSEDWDKYRNEIISLYKDGNKTLKEVAHHMETHHQFHATSVILKCPTTNAWLQIPDKNPADHGCTKGV